MTTKNKFFIDSDYQVGERIDLGLKSRFVNFEYKQMRARELLRMLKLYRNSKSDSKEVKKCKN